MISVLQKDRECWVCGRTNVLHDHHVFYGYSNNNRKKSESRGLKVYLCPYHHNMSDEGVHFNKALDLELKQMAQAYYESHYGSRADFISEFGKNYL